jgi:hypothetical protein
MGALLGGLLLTTLIFATALLLSRRPASTERRLTHALLARQIAPALYRRRMEVLAHRRRPAGRALAFNTDSPQRR